MVTRFTLNSLRVLSRETTINNQLSRAAHSVAYPTKCEGITVEPRDKVLWMKFNRPKKYNAITKEMYEYMTETLNQANKDNSINSVVVTGNGEYYSSGNDLSNFLSAMQDEGGPKGGLTKARNILYNFVNSFINFEKLLIAAVNGPAVGIPVTTLGLFDYVVASNKATFTSPFTSLGQCPEGCSSYTFPRIMGYSRASEMLLLNMKWSVQKAQNYGLVSEVIDHEKFHSHLEELLYGKKGLVNTCYPNSMKVSKSLVRDPQSRQMLMEVNRRECNAILECWLSEECSDAVQKFFQRSNK